MIDIKKQIKYWITGAFVDLESARILVEKNRLLHGLFFCHLVLEKAIKAHVVNRPVNLRRVRTTLYFSLIKPG